MNEWTINLLFSTMESANINYVLALIVSTKSKHILYAVNLQTGIYVNT